MDLVSCCGLEASREVDRQEAEESRWEVRADTTEAAELTVNGL